MIDAKHMLVIILIVYLYLVYSRCCTLPKSISISRSSAMDSSHVSLIAIFLRSEGFQHYRADRNMSLGINLVSMSKILKCSSLDDIITLRAENDGDQLELVFDSPNNTRASHFQLRLMDIDSEHLGIPATPYKCDVKMSSVEFKRICSEMTVMGDTIKISVSKDGITFAVSGDMGTGSIICKQTTGDDDQKDAVIIKLDEEVALTFALRYLNSFAKATPLSSTISLKMSPNVPLVLEYTIEGVGHIRYYLAPKIEDEEKNMTTA